MSITGVNDIIKMNVLESLVFLVKYLVLVECRCLTDQMLNFG